MQHRTGTRAVILPVLIATFTASACAETEPVAPEPGAYLQAAVESAENVITYREVAYFQESSNPAAGIDRTFSVRSASDSSPRSLKIYRQHGGRPAAGRYTLVALDPANPALEGFTAWYDYSADGTAYRYVARSGELVVRESSADVIAGTFEIEARLRSEVWGGGRTPGGRTYEDGSGVPTLRIRGSFRAVPPPEMKVYLEPGGS